jgi:hypothetical protein
VSRRIFIKGKEIKMSTFHAAPPARITPQQLRDYGFSARRLKEEGGFDAYQLRQAAFEMGELKDG